MTDDPFIPRPALDAARMPIKADTFAAMMARLGPFESAPHLAVGVSGGADSMALALLAHEWATPLGGQVTALIVDHGLRTESTIEAISVKKRLAARGIAAHVLAWQGAKPKTGIQAAARRARYDLLAGWARDHDVLHLLLGHHQGDQVETFLMRLDAKSGVDGLAAMSAITERDGVRIVRPFLSVPKVQLVATMTDRKTRWIDDPSNKNRAFQRVRVRDGLADGDSGLGAGRLGGLAREIGQLRIDQEKKTWDALADAVSLRREGFAVVDRDALAGAEAGIAFRVLHATLRCIGGQEYGPRLDRTERLFRHLMSDRPVSGRTLGGCGVFALNRKDGGARFIICRERRGKPRTAAAFADSTVHWDARFVMRLGRADDDDADGRPLNAGPFWIAPLGANGWREIVTTNPTLKGGGVFALPGVVRPSLPALMDADGVVAVPHVGYARINHKPDAGLPLVSIEEILFRPRASLSGNGFCLA